MKRKKLQISVKRICVFGLAAGLSLTAPVYAEAEKTEAVVEAAATDAEEAVTEELSLKLTAEKTLAVENATGKKAAELC